MIGEYKDNASTATPTDDWLVRQETVWLGDIPVTVITKLTATGPIQAHYVHADQLNTPRVIVNQTNTIVWRWENTHAFGANLPNEDPDGNGQLFEYHPRFPGQYFDKETGLHYNYFRYYEPETGRYLSPDPIGLMGGINIYGYVGQNPLRFVDPYGLWAIGDPLPQGIVNAIVGFGDGISSFATFGMYSTIDVRNSLGINNGVDYCSSLYSGGKFAGYARGTGTLWAAGLNGGSNSVFWVGNTARSEAASLGTTIAKTPIGWFMNRLGIENRTAWRIASSTFAANASGTATVVARSVNPSYYGMSSVQY
ncbi:RHS repeat-associated core domain-containing protein [Nitrosomonas sp.]|uniref:RHS repeat-associated core domain-containing protein n=1 Tax=Nitrosomonas sp. TaxID=42353 RepID=UPI0025F2665F|nr:RHS repeat-associated core domain-containing protein [Nitrosomonas sp.]